jgi:GPH family glycoside/pentoside/hexuronide:cation symporter
MTKIKLINPLVRHSVIKTTNAQQWAYSLGNLGCALPYQAIGAVLLFFYVDVHTMAPMTAAAVMTGYAIYNALNNPLMGYLSDQTKTIWGRRIPYVLFGTIPYALFFSLLFLVPFSGSDHPTALLVWFILGLFLFETMATIVQTTYYAAYPEMFSDYKDRTSIATRMNLFQVIGLVIGAALPISLARIIGWPGMGIFLGVITALALLIATRGMFERKSSMYNKSIPFGQALKATFMNRSFLTIVSAQMMRNFSTAVVTSGLAFYIKYSLGLDPTTTTIVLGTIFIVAATMLYPWKRTLAHWFEPRTNLFIAYALMGVSTIPLFFAQSLTAVILIAVLMGIALAGLLLMGYVTPADVIDEDEIKTGQRREGMYLGMSGMIITLAYAFSSIVFGWISNIYGYDPLLPAQPASVAHGFRVFVSIPPAIGSLLAILSLVFYPLHGKRLQEIKNTLKEKSASIQ